MPDISVVFGTYNRLALLRPCIESVRKACGRLSHEIIITDGGSTDGTLEYLRAQPDVRLVEHGELRGAVQAYYDAFQVATGTYVCYLSDDLTVPADMFQAAVAYLEDNPDCGVVSLPYTNPGGTVVALPYVLVGGKRLPFASFGVLRWVDGEEIDWCSTATYHYYLDVNICLGIHTLGLTVKPLPYDASIIHHMADNSERGTTWRNPNASSKRDAEQFHKHWRGRI